MEHENRNKADTGAAIEKKFSLEKRLGEVEKVIAKLYEDYALGKAGADEIDLLLPKYRKEQGELKAQLALFEEESSEQRETAARLNTLILTGELWTYLADLNEQAQERLDTIMEQMKATEGVTEELKRTSQMEWVQRCNNIHNRAEEIILHEMIYA